MTGRYPAIVSGAVWALVSGLAVGLVVAVVGFVADTLDEKDQRIRTLERTIDRQELVIDRLDHAVQLSLPGRRAH